MTEPEPLRTIVAAAVVTIANRALLVRRRIPKGAERRTHACRTHLCLSIMIENAVHILSLIAVVAALYFSAVQTRKLRHQVQLSNLFSRYEALSHACERYDAGLAMLFQRPDLRPYVLGDKPLDLCGEDRARALLVADQMLGAMDFALRVGSRFPDNADGDWSMVVRQMAKRSVFREVVAEKPHEFPDLVRYFELEEKNEGVRAA